MLHYLKWWYALVVKNLFDFQSISASTKKISGFKKSSAITYIPATRADVINLKDHLAELHRQHDLSTLRAQRLQNVLITHVRGAAIHAVHAKTRVRFRRLPGLDFSERRDRRQPGVLRQRQRNRLQGIREGAHRVLLQADHLRRRRQLCSSDRILLARFTVRGFGSGTF